MCGTFLDYLFSFLSKGIKKIHVKFSVRVTNPCLNICFYGIKKLFTFIFSNGVYVTNNCSTFQENGLVSIIYIERNLPKVTAIISSQH